MEKMIEKISDFLKALKTLENVLKVFYEHKALCEAHPTEQNEESFLIVRDATIQRFEYCTDLIWKVLKVYLEDVEKIDLPINSPRFILREAVGVRLLSESEGKECMNMVDSRNKTSHIYHEEVANDIANKIPQYYVLMKQIIDRMQDLIAKQ